MDFFNAIWFWSLLGLAAMTLPVVLHLLNRSAARETDWGAMRFLEESLAKRTRHIRLEDALLLSCRCLLLALLAMGLARPFIPPGAAVPWLIVLPLVLLAVVVFGCAMALWGAPLWRGLLVAAAILLLLLAGALVMFEKRLNLKRFGSGGAQDIAVVIDASASMDAVVKGQSNFARAQEEARELLLEAPGGSAFAVLLGGPVARPLVATPTTKIEDLTPAIERARSAAGTMNAPATLRDAIRALERGKQPAKQIVLFTDAQREGWQLEDPIPWEDFKDPPRVVLRRFERPDPLSNLAVTGLELSRDVIGPDRPVRITVSLSNTGELAVTPRALRLAFGSGDGEGDDETLVSRSFGSIAPGTTETAVFEHRFLRAGTHLLRASVEVEDDLPRDNQRPFAVNVVGGLSVLLVEGRPTAPRLERATTFAATALAPLAAGGAGSDEARLIDTRVVPAAEFDAADLAGVATVVLCDVPQLPDPVADALGSWVLSGGGLLIAPGTRIEAGWYNRWRAPGGSKVLPLVYDGLEVTDPEKPPVMAALTTFRHPALSVVSEAKRSDLGKTLAHAYWKIRENEERVLARWSNGDPLLAAHPVGRGEVIQLGFGLGPESTTLPARLAFLPFLHELVYHLAAPRRPQLNLRPSARLDLPFPVGKNATALGPDNQARPVVRTKIEGENKGVHEGRSTRLSVGGDIVPGVWTVSGQVPAAFVDETGRAPFVVTANPAEGDMEPLTDAEIATLGERIEIVPVDSVGEAAGLLSGRKFGKELWKVLVVAVFLLLLAEVALTRWIAQRRQLP